MTNLILIAAISENYVIGKNGRIPWRIPEDLRRFKELTIGKTVVVTRGELRHENIVVVHSIEDALKQCEGETFIIGGQQLYEQTINMASRLEITHVHQIFEGDAFFPRISDVWEETKRIDKDGYSFVTYLH